MKFKALLLVSAMALALAGTAQADKGDVWFGVGGGLAMPMTDLGDLVNMGWNGNLSGAYGVAKNCNVGVDLGYHAWKGKDDVDGFDLSDLEVSALQASAFTTYAFPTGSEKVSPYIKVGAGLYNVKGKLDAADFDQSKSKFGFNVGGGLNFMASPMYTVGVAAAYHMIMLDDEEFTNKDDEKFNPSVVTVGVNLAFGMGK